MSRPRQLLTLAMVLAFAPGAVCLGPLPTQLAGTWEGSCSLGRTIPFTLDRMMFVSEGDDLLVDATGRWALYLGSGEWDGVVTDTDLAVCVDEAFCRLGGIPFRPDHLVAVFAVTGQPALQGRWLRDEDRLTGDCFVGQSAGTFSAER